MAQNFDALRKPAAAGHDEPARAVSPGGERTVPAGRGIEQPSPPACAGVVALLRPERALDVPLKSWTAQLPDLDSFTAADPEASARSGTRDLSAGNPVRCGPAADAFQFSFLAVTQDGGFFVPILETSFRCVSRGWFFALCDKANRDFPTTFKLGKTQRECFMETGKPRAAECTSFAESAPDLAVR